MHLDQAVAPGARQYGGLHVDAVDVVAVELLERRELARHTLDQVGQSGGFVIAVGDREDVHLDDMVAAGGSCDSSYASRMACEPTTMTSGCWMIWQAVRIACSS